MQREGESQLPGCLGCRLTWPCIAARRSPLSCPRPSRVGVRCRACACPSSWRRLRIAPVTSWGSDRTASISWRCCASSRPATRSSASSASPGSPGGQVASAMVCCARLGWRARYLGRFGSDELGDIGRNSLTAEGVDLTAAEVIAGAHTRFAMILVDGRTGDRTVLWDRDARLALTAADVPAARRAHRARAARRLRRRRGFGRGGDNRPGVRRHHRDRRRSGRPRPRSPAAADRHRDCLRRLPGALDGLVGDWPRPRAARRRTPARADVRHARSAREPRALPGTRDSHARVPRPLRRLDRRRGRVPRRVHRGAAAAWTREVEVLLRMANAVAALKCRTAGAREGLPHPAELAALLAEDRTGRAMSRIEDGRRSGSGSSMLVPLGTDRGARERRRPCSLTGLSRRPGTRPSNGRTRNRRARVAQARE